jgi:DNA-binding MarR family transcriptional regulator
MSRDNASKDPKESARFAYEGLDRLLHERARLSILTSLAAHADGLVFNDLKMLCALTDGNLSRQLQILAEADMVEIVKSQRNNRPLTLAKLTPAGRKRFSDYLQVLQSVLADAAKVEHPGTSREPRPQGGGRGLSTA